jgi:hypothetical protein
MVDIGKSFVVVELEETIFLGREGPVVVGASDFFTIDETIVDESLVDVEYAVCRDDNRDWVSTIDGERE